MKFIDWKDIKATGKGNVKTTCPNCSHERKKKSEPCLSVNLDTGVAKCWNCEALSFRDKKQDAFELPKQDWQNYTKLSDKMVKWVEKERNIPQDVLIEMGVTEEKHYQPALGKEVNNIVFNYFEGDVLVNKKYRTGSKHFTQSKGTKSIFYNINSVIDAKEVWIVEGEFDVLALVSIGIRRVISVPNGANDNDEYWKNSEEYLKGVEKFIIAVDNDEKGNELKDKIAQRLGRYRCEYVEWEHKDANGELINNKLRSAVFNRKRFPVSGTFTIEGLKEDILKLYRNGLPETIYPQDSCFGDLHKIYKGMRGHVCTITGIPSHGKSSFAEWYILNLINDYGMKASFFSPEHSPMELHQSNFIQKTIGKPFWKDHDGLERITEEDIERYVNWANEKIYITSPENGSGADWDWIFDTFKEQVYSYGIDIFVIDAFNKVLFKGGKTKDKIDDVLTRLTMFAQMNNVMIFLVAHPTKMRKTEAGIYEIPSLYDVSGSADFRNQTHDGFCVYRYFGEDEFTKFVNLKTKFSFQGEIMQDVNFDYHVPTGRYYARTERIPLFDMTQQVELKPVEEIETPDELPF